MGLTTLSPVETTSPVETRLQRVRALSLTLRLRAADLAETPSGSIGAAGLAKTKSIIWNRVAEDEEMRRAISKDDVYK